MGRLPLQKLRERAQAQAEELAELRRQALALRAARGGGKYARYRHDPEGYARDILKVQWWEKQQEIARALLQPPHRVLVRASHSVGKSHLLGGLVNWWYDTRDPGVVLTTAPTARQVRDVLWKEVRRQRAGRGGFPGPKIPRLESSPTHFAYGFTATTAEAFQGQHEAAVLILIDEAVGVPREIWEAADSMVQGVEYGIVAVCNPTDTGSEFYSRESQGGWHVVRVPCTDHPNITAELEGRDPPYPQAVRLAWLRERVNEWCEPVPVGFQAATDLEFDGRHWRPGPLAEARLLGLWPSAAAGVWSDALWALAERGGPAPAIEDLPEIGCDVARFGDDNTEIHVRCGSCSFHHEAHNGWGTDETAGRLKQLAREWSSWASNRRLSSAAPIRPEQILVKIDDDGVGGGVVDQAGDFAFIPVGSGRRADRPDDFPNVRSELWFATAERAKSGRLDLSGLDKRTRQELKRQAVAPRYKLDAAGRRVVEPKDKTKKDLGRSPDGMDALNLAYYPASRGGVAEWVDTANPRRSWRDRH